MWFSRRERSGARLGLLWALAAALSALAAEPDAADPIARSLQVLRAPGGSAEARQQALEELRTIGQQAAEVVEGLVQTVTDASAVTELRLRAAAVLAELGPLEESAGRRVLGVVGDPQADLELRRALLLLFSERSDFVPLLTPMLSQVVLDPDTPNPLRRQAVLHLRDHLDQDGVQAALVTLLGSAGEEPTLRLAALDALRRPGAVTPELVSVLAGVAGTDSASRELRSGAMEILGSLGPPAASAAPALAEVLTRTDTPDLLRGQALEAIRRMAKAGDLDRQLTPALFRQELPARLRADLAEWLGPSAVARVAEPAAWMGLLADAGQPLPVRRLAAGELARHSPPPPELAALWLRLLAHPGEEVALRLLAGEQLRRAGTEPAGLRDVLPDVVAEDAAPLAVRELAAGWWVELALDRLERPDRLTREQLASGLAWLAESESLLSQSGLDTPIVRQGLERIRRLREVLVAEQQSRWGDRLRQWAEAYPAKAWGLGLLLLVTVFGAGVATAWALVVRWAPAKAWDRPGWITWADRRIPRWLGGDKAASRLEAGQTRALMERALSLDQPERSAAIEALAGLGPRAVTALPALRAACRDAGRDLDIRYAALTVLGLLGPAAAPARPDLLVIARDRREQVYVRLKAIDALDRVGLEAAERRALASQLSDPEEPEVLRRKAAGWTTAT